MKVVNIVDLTEEEINIFKKILSITCNGVYCPDCPFCDSEVNSCDLVVIKNRINNTLCRRSEKNDNI